MTADATALVGEPRHPGHATGGRLVYAVGDVHGRDDLLGPLLDDIAADAGARRAGFADRPLVVFLGDYIDRGPRSRQVIERVLALRARGDFEVRCLLGNHEEAMLDFMDRRTNGSGWARRGGRATMQSYGVRVPPSDSDRAAWAQARDAMNAAVPAEHVALLRELELVVECGDLLFVHAGLRPGVALAEQAKRDLLWIRTEFLGAELPFEKYIVHGHTPGERAFIGFSRMNLDSGAYASGILSAARFDGSLPIVLESGRR